MRKLSRGIEVAVEGLLVGFGSHDVFGLLKMSKGDTVTARPDGTFGFGEVSWLMSDCRCLNIFLHFDK